MSPRFCFILCSLSLIPVAAMADRPSLLKMFRRTPVVQADGNGSYELTEADGPWLILASTQVGDGSKHRAEQLALEIRRDLGLPAFIYREDFDFTGTFRQHATSAKKLRYANQYRYEAYAVLAGEYDTVNHPSIERDLQAIRTADLNVLKDQDSVSGNASKSSPIELVKALTSEMLRSRKDKQLGPMGKAFVTRNPMLPKEYFTPPQVDSFVHQLNDDVPYSLLQCEGKYTVVVKTFEGEETLVDGKHDREFEPNGDRLGRKAKYADRMTAALRKQGVEAYQFHDRSRSIVTVGSFDVLGRELPGGQFEYSPQIRRTMKEYAALKRPPRTGSSNPGGRAGHGSQYSRENTL